MNSTRRVAAVAVDLDGTIAHFHGPRRDRGFFRIFTNRGISETTVEKVYQETMATIGFSIPNFLSVLSKYIEVLLSIEDALKEFDAWVETEFGTFPDSRSALERWKSKCTPIIVLTAGEAEYQKKKVHLADIYYNRLIIVTTSIEKVQELRAISEEYGHPVVFYDDNPRTLDTVKESGLDVETVWVKRANDTDEAKPKLRHRKIATLDKE